MSPTLYQFPLPAMLHKIPICHQGFTSGLRYSR